ncbi:MAG: CcmD family protein [Saprospirales bacterium]|nr:MAG: CcmD family protein [Saprospirales bacterium]
MMYLNPVNDFMRSIGKIWVVVASLLIIFFGIVVFLYFIERRISKLEKEFDNEQQEH